MKKRTLAAVAVLSLFLIGCGGDGGTTVVGTLVILPGDAQTDGYAEDGGTPVAFQADGIRVQSPIVSPPSPERRGFASFFIGDIPVGALIDPPTDVRLFVVNVIQDTINPGVPRSGIPVKLDVYHVSYGAVLLGSDFFAPRTLVTTFVLFDEDSGALLPFFDYTPEFQVDVDDPTRSFFQLMLIARDGVVEIEDAENAFLTGQRPSVDALFF